GHLDRGRPAHRRPGPYRGGPPGRRPIRRGAGGPLRSVPDRSRLRLLGLMVRRRDPRRGIARGWHSPDDSRGGVRRAAAVRRLQVRPRPLPRVGDPHGPRRDVRDLSPPGLHLPVLHAAFLRGSGFGGEAARLPRPARTALAARPAGRLGPVEGPARDDRGGAGPGSEGGLPAPHAAVDAPPCRCTSSVIHCLPTRDPVTTLKGEEEMTVRFQTVLGALAVLALAAIPTVSGQQGGQPGDNPNLTKQKQTIVDVRSVGTAMYTWYKDEVEPKRSEATHKKAEAESESESIDVTVVPAISPENLEKVLVPKYIERIPRQDGWGNPYEFRLNTTDPNA